MHDKLFEAALGISAPWSVKSVDFDEAAKLLTVLIDFKPGTRFAISGHEGVHPVHDTVTKTYRHLNFFQHECHPAGAYAAREAAQRLGAPGRAGLRGPPVGLHAAVRGVDPDAGAADAVCGGGAHRGRVGVPGDGGVRALCRDGARSGRLQRRARRWPSTRPRVPAVTTTSRWRPTPSSAGCCSSPRDATPRRSSELAARAGRPRLPARADRLR